MGLTQAPLRAGDDSAGAAMDAAGGHGGWLATTLSALAFVFSGFSFYMSALQQADLEVYVPPVLQYGRDGGGEVDVFAIPITIANNGANTGTVLAIEVTVSNTAGGTEKASKTFYSAFIGEHPRNADTPNKTFAPISVPGRATYSETIRFYPQGNPLPKVVSEAGVYTFRLSITIAEPADPGLMDKLFKARGPAPFTFTRNLPFISEQHLAFRRGTISMHDKDWKPTASGAK
ncbi:MAG: hypothetical protein ACKVP7_26295 [Hyphomicrobiaceae bacterium]